MKEFVYLDNAATSFPKPPEIYKYMYNFFKKKGVSPGRTCSNFGSDVERLFQETRKKLTRFLGGDKDYKRLVFSYNATDSLNTAIQGILNKGDHVVTTTLEHNAVLRPLNHLAADGIIDVDFISFDEHGFVNPDDIKKSIKKNTKLVSVIHGSNVLGTIQPVKEIGAICKERGIIFLVDASQTAGIVPVDMQAMNIDIVAFPGHKSLFGPAGIGGMYVREGVDIRATRFGGTGIGSASEYQLEEYPFHLEAGTPGILGVAGLYAGQKYIAKRGLENIYKYEMELFICLLDGLKEIPNVKIYCAGSEQNHLPVLSFNLENELSADVSTMLNTKYNISSRPGLHCAPKLHTHFGTLEKGMVRLSIGALNTIEDIDYTISAVRELAEID